MDIMKAASGEEIIPSSHHHIVPHAHGFDETDVRGMLEGAGLERFSFKKATSATMAGNPADLFIAVAFKPTDG
jgi:hypothetical protein